MPRTRVFRLKSTARACARRTWTQHHEEEGLCGLSNKVGPLAEKGGEGRRWLGLAYGRKRRNGLKRVSWRKKERRSKIPGRKEFGLKRKIQKKRISEF